jgi:hypothetical protein
VSELSDRWRTSSFSNTGNCVQVRHDDSVIQVRDSKNPDGPVLAFTRPEWDAFLKGVYNGEFDTPDSRIDLVG